MKKCILKILSAMLVVFISLGIFTGCGVQKAEKKEAEKPAVQPAVSTPSAPVDLTYWCTLDSKAAVTMKSYSEMAMYKKMQEKMNVRLTFQHPTLGQEKEQFNLMLASGQLPDIIFTKWTTAVAGGPGKVLQDGAIIKLNDKMAQYAPNLKKLLDKSPQGRKQSTLDDGTIYMFPFFRLETPLRINRGLMMRKDWLDKLGLNPPATLDDWYNVLKAFREKDPNGNGQADELPIISTKFATIQVLATAWGIRKDYFTKGDKILYGAAEPAYKDFLTTMNKWYSEKLIDPDFPTTDTKGFDAKVTGNLGGAFDGLMNGQLGMYMSNVAGKDTKFELKGIPNPIGPAGKSYSDNIDINAFTTGEGAAITNSNKHVVESMKFLDYAYGEEGNLLCNFGIEGESYKMENGYPRFTDLILKNPKGLAPTNAIINFCLASSSAPFNQDQRYGEQFRANIKQQLDAEKEWGKSTGDIVPPSLTVPESDSKKFGSIMNQVNTYVDEMTYKFIMGTEPISKFDDYIKTIKGMGIDDAVKIMQASFDRYNKQ